MQRLDFKIRGMDAAEEAAVLPRVIRIRSGQEQEEAV